MNEFFCSYSRVANYKQAFVFPIVNEGTRISKMCNTNNSVLVSSMTQPNLTYPNSFRSMSCLTETISALAIQKVH